MLNRGVFVIKIKKRYKSTTFYKNKVPIQSFLAEISPRSKANKKLRVKLRFAGKIGHQVIDSCLPNRYFLVEGSLTTFSILGSSTQRIQKSWELNVYKIYPISTKPEVTPL